MNRGFADLLVLGIDPAPAKDSVVFDGETFDCWSARDVRQKLGELGAAVRPVLVAWDAPLSFTPAMGFSDRPVDKAARKWLKAAFEGGSGVNALPFSGCPHWAISCDALGLPFRSNNAAMARLAASPDFPREGIHAIEVHPAVALAWWWVRAGETTALPDYKRGPRASRSGEIGRLIEALAKGGASVPADAHADDDHLDAWVAWRMGFDFVGRSADWFGAPDEGGYVLPAEACAAMADHLDRVRGTWGKG